MAEERFAFGIILASVERNEPRYLLMRSASHGTWGAPKGHAEPGEEPFETARRETEEETGIDSFDIVEGFKREFSYRVAMPRGNYLKHVTYWLATVAEARHTQSEEHDKSGWYAIDEILERLQYDQMKEVFRDADRTLRRQQSGG